MPARSPHLWGAQLPLCWRCTGILAGALLLLGWLMWRRRVPSLRLSLALALLLPLDVLCAVLMHTDGNNARRLSTGVLWGIFGTSLFLHLFRRAALWASTRTRTTATTLPDTTAT